MTIFLPRLTSSCHRVWPCSWLWGLPIRPARARGRDQALRSSWYVPASWACLVSPPSTLALYSRAGQPRDALSTHLHHHQGQQGEQWIWLLADSFIESLLYSHHCYFWMVKTDEGLVCDFVIVLISISRLWTSLTMMSWARQDTRQVT